MLSIPLTFETFHEQEMAKVLCIYRKYNKHALNTMNNTCRSIIFFSC